MLKYILITIFILTISSVYALAPAPSVVNRNSQSGQPVQTLLSVSQSPSSFVYQTGVTSGTVLGSAADTLSPSIPATSVTWSLSGTNASEFAINSSTGVVTTNGSTPTCASLTSISSVNAVATSEKLWGSPFTQSLSISCTPALPQILQADISSTNTPAITAETGDNFSFKPFPLNVQAGDAIVCGFSWVSGVTMSSISDGIGGDTWSTTPVESADNGAGNIKSGLFVLPNSAGGAVTMNVVFGSNTSPFQHNCWEINNIATSSPSNGGQGVANIQYPTVDPGTFTPGANTLGNFVISYAALAFVDANQSPSLFTNSGSGCGWALLEADVAFQTGNGFPHSSMGCTQVTPAAVDPKLTLSGGSTSDFYNVVSVALKIASAGGTMPSGIHINNLIHLTGTPKSGTTMTVQFPTTGTLRAIQFLGTTTSNSTVTDSDGSTYNYTTGCTTSGNGNCWAYANGAPNPNLTITMSQHVTGGSSNRLVDIQGANASPFDTSADASLSCTSVTSIAHAPDITPSGANELILDFMAIGDGPGTAVTSPSGAIFPFTTYPGQGDSSQYDNSDAMGTYYNGANTSAENWTFSLKSNPSNQCNASAIAFKP